ncbi:hypothetical protein QYF61_001986 [Mycteria americana]|uniref:Uncharacterized protein n=1 Tax=Mycteria americana TaxID=33587 RepID=A0AAN7MJ08_MYCAM|nr:hypothetical protein QYF61_001986 [Mycteria americana]
MSVDTWDPSDTWDPTRSTSVDTWDPPAASQSSSRANIQQQPRAEEEKPGTLRSWRAEKPGNSQIGEIKVSNYIQGNKPSASLADLSVVWDERLSHSSTASRITESQNHIGWKRPLRSSSPTVNLTLPKPPLHHVSKYLIQTPFKYLQGWGLNHFPGQPVPMLDNPLGEEKFPNIQSKPPLAQLEAISSLVESEEVSPQPPFLQAEQAQGPQPLPISLVLQTLPQLRCPSLGTLQYLNIPLVVGGPKLNTVFEVQPHQCRVQGHDHFPSPAGHAIFDTSQDAIGLLGRLIHTELHRLNYSYTQLTAGEWKAVAKNIKTLTLTIFYIIPLFYNRNLERIDKIVHSAIIPVQQRGEVFWSNLILAESAVVSHRFRAHEEGLKTFIFHLPMYL